MKHTNDYTNSQNHIKEFTDPQVNNHLKPILKQLAEVVVLLIYRLAIAIGFILVLLGFINFIYIFSLIIITPIITVYSIFCSNVCDLHQLAGTYIFNSMKSNYATYCFMLADMYKMKFIFNNHHLCGFSVFETKYMLIIFWLFIAPCLSGIFLIHLFRGIKDYLKSKKKRGIKC